MSKTAAVIGGGVAGIAAAVALAESGLHVTLIEKRALMGGRAGSFIDGETGERVDNCQHVTMRCCTNLQDLYTRLGVAHKIKFYPQLTFQDGAGIYSSIQAGWLPAPLHAAPSFLKFKALALRDKLAIGRGLLSILRARPDPRDDDRSMADWMRDSRQTSLAIRRFWTPIMVSACNEEPDRVSCTSGFKLFRDGFLVNACAYQIGLPTVPLGDLYTEPAVRYLEARSATIRLKQYVDSMELNQNTISALTLGDGETVAADYYVSALPFDILTRVVPPDRAALPYFANIAKLTHSPITSVHLWFDRPIAARSAIAVLDRTIQWIFNKTDNYENEAIRPEGTYLGLVVSSSRALADMPREDIVKLAMDDLRSCLPEVASATLVKWHVIKERKATFSPAPGTARLRPASRSPIANLYVAGDFTDTGWPATMESAARSGYLAANALLKDMGCQGRPLVPDLKPSWLALALMRR